MTSMKTTTNFLTMSSLRKHSFNSMRSRMLLIFLVLLTLITVITLSIVNSATYQHSTGQWQSHAQTSASVVKDRVLNQVEVLHEGLVTASTDFSLRSLIFGVDKDTESLIPAMNNVQTRTQADIYWVTDNLGKTLLSSTNAESLTIAPNSIIDGAVNWFKQGNNYYLIQAAPIKKTPSSRHIDYWIVMGIAAHKLITTELVELTDMQVSLLWVSDGKQVVASTFAAETSNQLVSAALVTDTRLHEVNLGRAYIYAAFPLGLWQQAPIYSLVAASKDYAYLDYTSLLLQLVALLAVAAALSLGAAMLFSNGVTKPIAKLADNARKISNGDYQVDWPSESIREVNALSTAFKQMINGIREREDKIQYLAYYDELTGLPNRLRFSQYIHEAISDKAANKVIVVMLDIDRFKEINDTVGHDTGDKLLNLIAQRMKTYADQNTLYARLGGDEFGIVMNNANNHEPEILAQNIANLFEQPFAMDNLTLDVEASIGAAIYPYDAESAEGLIQCADIALYSCKGQHVPYAIYKPALNKHSVQRLNLMSELREALAQGQLQLHYQAKLSIRENEIQTVECLIRWIHPVHGFIPPDEFIPLAEQTGAIRHVTHWALREALKQHSQWRQKGYRIGLAVNISAVDLVDMKLPAYVSELLSEFDIDANVLTLEVTESAVMGDPQNALKALNTLRRMGIVLSIDDFGTGYSSMAQLKKMPVDELKIDKAFVLDLASNKEDQVMVKTLVSLAQNLGLQTVAEGVEDANSLAYLAQIGCTKAQGFYLSRPLPAEKFDQWFNQYQQQKTQSA